MAQSLSLIYVHIVFHTGNLRVTIRPSDKDKLYAYIGGILKQKECLPVRIGGMPDHVHILTVLSKNMALADVVREIKRSTTIRLKAHDSHYRNFKWQNGYGAFSVGVSSYDKTIKYIDNQENHHRKLSFREEYLLFLKESGMEYNEEYLWTDK